MAKKKKTMKTGNNIATNNYILRLWSCDHYGEKYKKSVNIFHGTIQNVQTKEQVHIDNVADFQKVLHKQYEKDEKNRRKRE